MTAQEHLLSSLPLIFHPAGWRVDLTSQSSGVGGGAGSPPAFANSVGQRGVARLLLKKEIHFCFNEGILGRV